MQSDWFVPRCSSKKISVPLKSLVRAEIVKLNRTESLIKFKRRRRETLREQPRWKMMKGYRSAFGGPVEASLILSLSIQSITTKVCFSWLETIHAAISQKRFNLANTDSIIFYQVKTKSIVSGDSAHSLTTEIGTSNIVPIFHQTLYFCWWVLFPNLHNSLKWQNFSQERLIKTGMTSFSHSLNEKIYRGLIRSLIRVCAILSEYNKNCDYDVFRPKLKRYIKLNSWFS